MGSRVDLLYISLFTGRPSNENFADYVVVFTQIAYLNFIQERIMLLSTEKISVSRVFFPSVSII